MKKYNVVSMILLGFVLGVSISYAPQLEAAASKLLGSKVGNVLQVKIDDKTIGEGAVINGTTYVPLRVTANEMGLEVTKVDSKEVVLSSPEGGEVPVNDIPQNNADQIKEINDKISELNKKIRESKDVISNKESTLRYIQSIKETWVDKEVNTALQETKQRQVETMNNMQKTLDDAETNLPLYEKQLEELKAQLTELQK